jgi:phosphoribosyl-AMP cyclohydrolase / phosphoribosyl-ATP pyrophosphohydrolase
MGSDGLVFDERGLIPVVAQDRLTGAVRMVAWMNAEALARTEQSGMATFWSRSRGELWEKGATSGHRLHVRSVWVDCDGDTLLLSVDPEGPSCHTGRESCFFRQLAPAGIGEPSAPEAGELERLERVIAERSSSSAEKSYTKSLFDGGAESIGAKIREEAGELAAAIAEESAERVAAEAADAIFHLMVGLASRGVSLRSVLEELARRSARSGHAEKAARGSGRPAD